MVAGVKDLPSTRRQKSAHSSLQERRSAASTGDEIGAGIEKRRLLDALALVHEVCAHRGDGGRLMRVIRISGQRVCSENHGL